MDYFHVSAGPDQLGQLSSLALAYLGDGVYEVMVRTWLCLRGKATNRGLHKAALDYVSAPAQARLVQKILPILTQEEQEVYRRGRNSHTAAVPKGASVGQYHAATALEALFGYVYLKGDLERLRLFFSVVCGEE